MPFSAVLIRRVLGAEIEPSLRPVLVVALLQTLAASARTGFMAIWVVHVLRASDTQLGVAFTCAAIAAVVSGYLAGHASDHIGRRSLILADSAAQAAIAAAFLAVGGRILLGLGLIVVAAAFEGAGGAADQALLSDLVAADRQEHAFAAARVVQNVGYVAGPALGGLALLSGWNTLFALSAGLGGAAFALAVRVIPRRGSFAPSAPPERASWTVIGRDRRFLALLVAGVLGATVYLAWETLLPVSLVQSHGLDPAVWGALLVLNPVAVAVFQLRLTARVAGVADRVKLVVGMLAMGSAFLLLLVSSSIAVVVLILAAVVVGEMLWAPVMQSLVARVAPRDLRGAYFGASSAIFPVAFAIGPLGGLTLRAHAGDGAMWVAIAATGLVAAVAYGLATPGGHGLEAGEAAVAEATAVP